MPIRRPEAARWDAYTIRASAGKAGSWQIRCRRGQAECNEMPGPRRHTRDIPTYRAWTLHAHCTDVAIHDFVQTCAGGVAQAGWGHLSARGQQCSDRTVCSTTCLPVPGAAHAADPRPGPDVGEHHNTRLPPFALHERPHRSLGKVSAQDQFADLLPWSDVI